MKLYNANKKKNENNRQYIYRVIKENIMTLNLKPGECISEIDLANLLNVSRTPIREAIVRLSEEKLIDVFPQKGSFISKIDLGLVDEAVFLRLLCEKKLFELLCIEKNTDTLIKELEKNLAYQKLTIEFDEDLHKFFDLDNQFHSLIFDYFNKKNIWKSIKRLSTHYDRLRLIDALEKPNAIQTLKQHELILKLIKEKNENELYKLISEHLSKFKSIIDLYLKKFPEYFVK